MSKKRKLHRLIPRVPYMKTDKEAGRAGKSAVLRHERRQELGFDLHREPPILIHKARHRKAPVKTNSLHAANPGTRVEIVQARVQAEIPNPRLSPGRSGANKKQKVV
jgi:hypothetical protein